MAFMHGLASAKVVSNSKCRFEEQSDFRSAARNFTVGLESQQNFSARFKTNPPPTKNRALVKVAWEYDGCGNCRISS